LGRPFEIDVDWLLFFASLSISSDGDVEHFYVQGEQEAAKAAIGGRRACGSH
jgi:hypothetical protein